MYCRTRRLTDGMAPSELWSQHGGGLGLHKETENSETEGL